VRAAAVHNAVYGYQSIYTVFYVSEYPSRLGIYQFKCITMHHVHDAPRGAYIARHHQHLRRDPTTSSLPPKPAAQLIVLNIVINIQPVV
jgi:hypothetical protein